MPTKLLISALIAAVLFVTSGTAAAQDGDARRARATELSRAWAAIGAGDHARAEQIALAILRARPADHAALTVAVAAVAASGRPVAALDVYEQWLSRHQHEDVFLLAPIATATLIDIAAGRDPGLAAEAATALASIDADAAAAWLARQAEAAALDPARAALGDNEARTRLVAGLSAPSSREKLLALHRVSGIRGLDPSPVAALLSDPAPPVRAAAAESLAQLQGSAAAQRLRPLLSDPDPFVRASAAVALGRIGDPAGLDAINGMAASPVGDTAAMAAEVLKARGVDVSAIVDRILADPNPLTRLSGVALLPDSDPRKGLMLSQAAADPNEVIRGKAGQVLSSTPSDVASLRRLLRDPSAQVRLKAAESLANMVQSQ
jgi:HEAT repeat protein